MNKTMSFPEEVCGITVPKHFVFDCDAVKASLIRIMLAKDIHSMKHPDVLRVQHGYSLTCCCTVLRVSYFASYIETQISVREHRFSQQEAEEKILIPICDFLIARG